MDGKTKDFPPAGKRQKVVIHVGGDGVANLREMANIPIIVYLTNDCLRVEDVELWEEYNKDSYDTGQKERVL